MMRSAFSLLDNGSKWYAGLRPGSKLQLAGRRSWQSSSRAIDVAACAMIRFRLMICGALIVEVDDLCARLCAKMGASWNSIAASANRRPALQGRHVITDIG